MNTADGDADDPTHRVENIFGQRSLQVDAQEPLEDARIFVSVDRAHCPAAHNVVASDVLRCGRAVRVIDRHRCADENVLQSIDRVRRRLHFRLRV